MSTSTDASAPETARRGVALPLAGLAGGWLAGLGVGALTVRLNPHLLSPATDALLVMLYLGLGAGLVGLLVGDLAEAGVRALERSRGRTVPSELGYAVVRRIPRPFPRLRLALGGALALTPVFYFLLLPQVGLAPPDLLTDWIFHATLGTRLLGVFLAAAAAALLGGLLLAGPGRAGRRASVAATLALSAALVTWGLWPVAADDARPTTPPPVLQAAATPPPPVVLLVVDGTDLSVLEPMVTAGELPAFARLMAEGSWGSLETLEPTLSAVVWTTLATGRPPSAHGIHHFVAFALPGVSQVVQRFPLHTGLNFTLFPWLETLPGVPPIQVPVTSDMRRAPALWEIVDEAYPVGVYSWLVSWPAQPVNGFYVAGGVGWAQFFEPGSGDRVPKDTVHPPDLLKRRWPQPEPVTEDDLAPYVTPGSKPDARLDMVRRSLRDATGPALAELRAAYRPRLTAASFYSVDAFSHFFARDRRDGGPFAPAIEQRYRETDARLGDFLETLEDDAQVILVSDHGYDFAQDHHTWAPPGVFFARGPAFRRGERIEGLSVYDVAPLALHLLGLPLARDMPGTAAARYRRALDPAWLDAHPVATVETYDASDDGPLAARPSPKDDEIREVLESLGYIR